MAGIWRHSLSEKAPEDWDELERKNNGFFPNTSLWAGVCENLGIGRGRYLRLFRDDVLILQVLLYESILGGPMLLRYVPSSMIRLLRRAPHLTSMSSHMSPTFIGDVDPLVKQEAVLECCRCVVSIAERGGKNIGPNDFLFTKDQPSAMGVIAKLSEEWPAVNFRIVGTTRLVIRPGQTTADEITYSYRKDIRRAQKRGVIIKFVDDPADSSLFYDGLVQSMRSNGLTIMPRKYYEGLMQTPHVKFVVGLHNGYLTGGSGLMFFGSTCLLFSTFTTDYERKNNTCSNYLVRYEVVQECLRRNVHSCDLNMIDVQRESEKQQRINAFKLGWGGEILYGISVNRYAKTVRGLQRLKKRFLGK